MRSSHCRDSPARSLTSVHHHGLPCCPWPASSNHCNWRERRAGTHCPPQPSLTCEYCAIPSNATNYLPAQLPALNLWLSRRGMSADSAPAEPLVPELGMQSGPPPLVDVWLPQEWGYKSLTFPRHCDCHIKLFATPWISIGSTLSCCGCWILHFCFVMFHFSGFWLGIGSVCFCPMLEQCFVLVWSRNYSSLGEI